MNCTQPTSIFKAKDHRGTTVPKLTVRIVELKEVVNVLFKKFFSTKCQATLYHPSSYNGCFLLIHFTPDEIFRD